MRRPSNLKVLSIDAFPSKTFRPIQYVRYSELDGMIIALLYPFKTGKKISVLMVTSGGRALRLPPHEPRTFGLGGNPSISAVKTDYALLRIRYSVLADFQIPYLNRFRDAYVGRFEAFRRAGPGENPA
jgi:hypothetical protein